MAGRFFTKNGRRLKTTPTPIKTGEISTLSDIKSASDKLILNKKTYLNSVHNYFKNKVDEIKSKGLQKTIDTIAAAPASVFLFIFAIIFSFIILIPREIKLKTKDTYSIYSSKPLQMKEADFNVNAQDSRAQKINAVFKIYNCPLEGLGETFVYEADRNNIPWWLTASVAFKESSCGKNTPTIDGGESYNAWGWGVYGDQTHSFDNWVRGIETVSEYFSERFYSQGITDLCDIMKIYTPPSSGSWCEEVTHFGEIFQGYKSPEIID